MKRLSALFLAVILCCGILTFSAGADSSGICGDETTWSYNSTSKTLTISGSYEMYDYANTSLRPWNAYSSEIKNVVIGNSVTYIGDNSFKDFSALTSVTLGTKVKTIGQYAFANCDLLPSITLTDSVNEIGNYAFDDCAALSFIIYGAKLQKIDSYAFRNCDALVSISIPDTVTSLGSFAFSDCDGITTFNTGSTVQSVGNSLLASCDKLTSATFGDSVLIIGNRACDQCAALETVVIGNKVTQIDEYAFAACPKLLYVTFGTSIETIGTGVFAESGILNANLPSTLKAISSNAFRGCHNLTSVKIKDGVEQIDTCAFQNCDYLKKITIPDSVKTIGKNAFSGCSILEYVNLGNGVTEIQDNAFMDCKKLQRLYIPSNVTKLGSQIIGYNTHGSRGTYTDDVVFYCAASQKPGNWASQWYYACSIWNSNYSEYYTVKHQVVWGHEHSTIFDVACDEDWECDECGLIIPASGHDYKDTVVPPTKDEDGYTEHVCQSCGDSYKDNYVPKLNACPVSSLGAKINPACSGLRLGCRYDASKITYERRSDIVDMGIVFYPTRFLDSELTLETEGAASVRAVAIEDFIPGNSFTDYESFVFYATIVDIPDIGKDKEISFRPYVIYNDETVEYGDVLSRSYNYVYKSLLASEYGENIIPAPENWWPKN